jgi:hypothetical protein
MKPTQSSTAKSMSNHIEEYFADASQSKEVLTSKELFRADRDNVDIKTDLSIQEIVLVNKLIFNNALLKDAGLIPVYQEFINSYLRLKISLDRKSRGEFVDMNRGQQKTEDILDTMSKVSNITGAKK